MKFQTEIRVRYAETDAMGIAYHGNYFDWMEVGRAELFRSIGLPYKQIEEEGIYIPVIEAHCKYFRPAKYDDEVIVETQVEKFSAAKGIIKYTMYLKKDATLLVEAQTVHAFVNSQGRPVNIKKFPKVYSKLLETV